MEMLNNFSLLLANDLWSNIINGFASWIVNYGWAIILFTICLKLVMSPLDIFQRFSSQKQSRFMKAMQPEMARLQEKYGNDRERLNQEQAKLYKKYNINVGGMCLSLAIPMIVSMIILFSLYGCLRSYGDDKLYTSYQELDKTYVTAQVEAGDLGYAEGSDEYTVYIEKQVKDKYNKQSEQNSWLWVKNVWKGDTNTSQFVDFEDYAEFKNLSGGDKDAAKSRYDAIVNIVEGDKDVQNGYYILIILAGVISLLTQFLTQKLTAPKGQKLGTMNYVMFAIVPITMIILAATSNVVFTLYVVTNSIMTFIISAVLTIVMKLKNKGKDDTDIVLPKKNVEVVEYSRNYKK